MNRRYPFRWQSFRCGGRRFIYSGGGRGAFQKLLDSSVALAHPHRARLVPDSRNRRLPIDPKESVFRKSRIHFADVIARVRDRYIAWIGILQPSGK